MAQEIWIYLLMMNLLGLILMSIDKNRAKRGAWRISERNLFLVSILGGSIGSWAGMYLFRHKTKHRSFVIGMPAILILQLAVAGGLVYANAYLH